MLGPASRDARPGSGPGAPLGTAVVPDRSSYANEAQRPCPPPLARPSRAPVSDLAGRGLTGWLLGMTDDGIDRVFSTFNVAAPGFGPR
jgi:hypothetical protein